LRPLLTDDRREGRDESQQSDGRRHAAGLGCLVGGTLGGFIGYWAGANGWTAGGEEPWARLLIIGGFIGSVAGVTLLSILNRKRGGIAESVIGGLIGIGLETAALAWISEYRR
jgi:hypothetical protein